MLGILRKDDHSSMTPQACDVGAYRHHYRSNNSQLRISVATSQPVDPKIYPKNGITVRLSTVWRIAITMEAQTRSMLLALGSARDLADVL